MNFKLRSEFEPAGDQPRAIEEIFQSLKRNKKHHVLRGATGTGKTFTMASIIQKVQKSTLIIAHNKTLAMQLYSEMKTFFPNNKVEYYVSFFDYYRPEAYKPNDDLYLEKRTQRNKGIEKMRMSALNSLATEEFVIVIASVASIYGCLNPYKYKSSFVFLKVEDIVDKNTFLDELFRIGYNTEKKNLRVFENLNLLKIEIDREEDSFLKIKILPETGFIVKIEKLWRNNSDKLDLDSISIPPIQYIIEKDQRMKLIISQIEKDLDKQKQNLISQGKYLESKRLEKRINNDIRDMKEFGFCNGIENYSIYFDGRKKGETPFVLLDFFKKGNFLTFIDESHITISQIKAMYNTDRNRKQTLEKYGFRLPSALDNRPLNFDEFISKVDDVVYVSATPGKYELEKVQNQITEQIIRPTGLLDPEIEIRSSADQIKDMIKEIHIRIMKNEKTLIYALTINMSEDIAAYLQEQGIKSVFVHSKMNVFERYQAISNLRRGIYDVIVGINLLKEGIDIPEVSLVCIIDADKSGFLRDSRSLIQIIGRASRNQNGKVIFYANYLTKDMEIAIKDTKRRRQIQSEHNKKNGLLPTTIKKDIKNITLDQNFVSLIAIFKNSQTSYDEKIKILNKIERMMKKEAKEFKFDKAIELRNLLIDLKSLID